LTIPHSDRPATGRPAVDVVILTWNDGPLLEVAVASALSSEGVDVAVTVIDNGSEPPASVVDDPRVTLVRNAENRGVAPARDQGVRLGTAPHVCLLDSDARLHEGALVTLVAALAGRSDVGLVAPVFAGQEPEASGGRRPGLLRKLARGFGLTASYGRTRPRRGAPLSWDVDFAIGACQVFRREAFDGVGGLDTSIFYGPEDVDFCLRLRAAGWRVLQVAHATVDHPPRRRHRRPMDPAARRHAKAVALHLWRHRRAGRRAADTPRELDRAVR
jgi:N-acetylglucosaminyl-diphospho-decaprenol L-rhamnosyltransferase